MAVKKLQEEDIEIPIEAVKKTIAIIQVTRFGDLIQTYQAAKEIRVDHPEMELILIARKQFATPLSFILNKVFSKIILLDLPESFENSSKNLSDFRNYFSKDLEKMNKSPIDVVLNLSFSRSASFISSSLNTQHRLGPYYGEEGNLLIHDKWSQFVYSNVLDTPLNPFSLVDIFKSIIGIEKRAAVEKRVHKKVESIIIHPFASHSRKMWKAQKWIETLYKVLKDNDQIKLTIVGSKDELEASQKICSAPLLKKFENRIRNITGQTSIEELHNEIKKSQLFIGHDSMVGHLAAEALVQTLTISLGTVRPFETTPYGEQNYALSPRTQCFPCTPKDRCDFHQCHIDIPYQAVAFVAQELINDGNISIENTKTPSINFHLNSVNLYQTSFAKDGFLEYRELIEQELSPQDIFKCYYRILWSYLLSEREEKSSYPQLSKKLHQNILNNVNGIKQIYELSEFGKKYTRYILEEISSQSPDINKIKDFSKKVDEIDRLKAMIKETYPLLSPIINYFTIMKGNILGDNLVNLTENAFYCYDECSIISSTLYELIEKTITQHKIQSTNQITKGRA